MIIEDYKIPLFNCFLLFLGMFSYWMGLFFPQQHFFFQGSSSLVFSSTVLFTGVLAFRWYQEGYFPLSNLYESLLFLSWEISVVVLYVEYQTKSRIIGVLTTPLLFFLSGFATLTLPVDMQKALPLVPSLQSNWLMMHVSMMMVSYATLIVGSLLSILYLFLIKFFIKKTFSNSGLENSKNATAQSTLGSLQGTLPFDANQISLGFLTTSKNSLLETIDIWSYRIIGLGFPFLTIGIISGAVWANEAWGSYWSWDPKETWALITWLTFAIYLHSRLLKGWQGEKAAFLGSCGFFVIWICYLGVNFLGKGLHSYGWVL